METSSGNLGGGIQASLGGRYAIALFELARDSKSIDTVEASLVAVRDALRDSDDFAKLTTSPLVARGAAVKAVLAAAGHAGGSGRRASVAGLTEREVDILRRLARGKAMKEIGRDLGISPKTVDNHLQRIYPKIGVRTRAGATLFAIDRGLVVPGEG